MWSAERKSTWFSEIFRVAVRFERSPAVSSKLEAALV
jgi:hypothetical protein